MKKFFWILTAIGSLLGGLVVIGGIAAAHGTPQEAVAVAIGLSLAVIPYCLARAVSQCEAHE
jgi:sugar phosphate permease